MLHFTVNVGNVCGEINGSHIKAFDYRFKPFQVNTGLMNTLQVRILGPAPIWVNLFLLFLSMQAPVRRESFALNLDWSFLANRFFSFRTHTQIAHWTATLPECCSSWKIAAKLNKTVKRSGEREALMSGWSRGGPPWQSLPENKIPCHLNMYQKRRKWLAQRKKSRRAGREGNPVLGKMLPKNFATCSRGFQLQTESYVAFLNRPKAIYICKITTLRINFRE